MHDDDGGNCISKCGKSAFFSVLSCTQWILFVLGLAWPSLIDVYTHHDSVDMSVLCASEKRM